MTITSFPIPTVNFYSSLERRVNAIDFGADPTGVADSTVAIQAAIDFAVTNQFKEVYLPSGIYKTSGSLYLDPPGNLRANLANPTMFSFSLTLSGPEGIGIAEGNWGAQIRCTFNDKCALFVGTGQAMCVRNLTILGLDNGYAQQQPSGGIGLGLCGGPGGSSRTLTENVMIQNFYTGIMTGANNPSGDVALCDSNTFIKCFVINNYRGFYFHSTQSFIDDLYDCQAASTISVDATFGTCCRVFGGNWTSGEGGSQGRAVFDVSGTSALTAGGFGNGFVYTFTTTVAAPDAFLAAGVVYNSFVMKTVHFGLVPLVLNSFNPSTNVASFTTLVQWALFSFGDINAKTTTDLEAEIQAVTRIYCVERKTTFKGTGISVKGIHLENVTLPFTLMDTSSSFGANKPSSVCDAFFNCDPSFENNSALAPANPDLGCFYVAQTFPLFISVAGDIHVYDSYMGCQGTMAPIVDVFQSQIYFSRLVDFKVNIRQGNTGATFTLAGMGVPAGISDRPYWLTSNTNDTASKWRSTQYGQSAFWGIRPAANETPAVQPSDVTAYTGVLPAISPTGSGCPYALVWGNTVYHITSYLGPNAFYNMVSGHDFYTYGQDLTPVNVPGLSWSYKGQSMCVYTDQLELIFPGLCVELNDGASDIKYVVTAVFRGLGYFTVVRDSVLPNYTLLSGLKTAVINGTTIKQQVFSVTQF